MLLKLNDGERDALVDTITEWLDEAEATELAFYKDRFIDDPEAFLQVIGSHGDRLAKLKELKGRLTNAA